MKSFIRGAGKSMLGVAVATALSRAAGSRPLFVAKPQRRKSRTENVEIQREIMAAAADKRARRALRPIPPTALVQR